MDQTNPPPPNPESANPLDPSNPSRIPPPPSPAAASAKRSHVSGSDKLWVVFSHLSWFIGFPFLLPIIVYLVMRGESDYVAENAKEALNFHISLLIYLICSGLLVFLLIGIPLLVALGIGALILSIIAAIKASDGIVYRYPLTIRLVT